MRGIFNLFFIYLLLIVCACEPIELDPIIIVDSSNPVFEVKGEILGLKSFEIQAGVGDYEMITSPSANELDTYYNISFLLDTISMESLDFYSSNLTKDKDKDCVLNTCSESLEFVFFTIPSQVNSVDVFEEGVNIEQVNDPIDFEHMTMINTSDSDIELSVINENGLEIQIEEGGYDIEIGTVYNTIKYKKPDYYTVTLNYLEPIIEPFFDICNLNITMQSLNDDTVLIRVFSDINSPGNPEIIQEYIICLCDSYYFSLTLDDPYYYPCIIGIEIEFETNTFLDSINDILSYTIDYGSFFTFDKDKLFVNIYYTNDNGVVYLSRLDHNHFLITSVDDFGEKNVLGQNILKLGIDFSSELISDDPNIPPELYSISMLGTGTIGVAYD